MENLLSKSENTEINLRDNKKIYQFVKNQEKEEHTNILQKIHAKSWIFPSNYNGLIQSTI